MRAAIYARYSAGPRQTDQSIDGQLRVCRSYCEQHGLTVIEEYCDRHISGRTDQRPEFRRMIDDAKQGRFEALVVYRTDRLSRDKYDAVIYKRELKRAGVKIHYAAEAIPEGPEGIILESLMEGLAEYYSAELAQKIRRGMHENALKAKSTGASIPLGFKVGPDKHYIIDPVEAEVVRFIFNKYVEGTPVVEITSQLNAQGFRTKKGQAFNKNSISRIVRNRKYIGEYKYNDVFIPGGMPQIIKPELFEMAQAEVERRRTRNAGRGSRAEYLLAGKLFCGSCKATMHGVSGTDRRGNKHYYYACSEHREHRCEQKAVPRDALELLVVRLICEYILAPETLESITDKIMAYQDEHNDTRNQIQAYEAKLREIKTAQDNIIRMIERGVATVAVAQRLTSLEAEQNALEEAIADLSSRQLTFTREQISFMLQKYAEPMRDETEAAYHKRLIQCLLSEAYIYKDQIVLLFNLSGDDGDLAEMRATVAGEFDCGLNGSTRQVPRRIIARAGFIMVSDL